MYWLFSSFGCSVTDYSIEQYFRPQELTGKYDYGNKRLMGSGDLQDLSLSRNKKTAQTLIWMRASQIKGHWGVFGLSSDQYLLFLLVFVMHSLYSDCFLIHKNYIR